jgi:hypothetical protein
MSLPITTFFMYYNQIEYLDALEQLKHFEAAAFPYQKKEDMKSMHDRYKKVVTDLRTKKQRVEDSWELMRKKARGKHN